MKKYLIFFLLMLMSIGSVAQTTTTELNVGEEGDVKGSTWKFREITDINGQLKEFDDLVISFDPAKDGNQYAICSATKEGGNYKKLVVFSDTQDWFGCKVGQTECMVKITSDLLKAINSGRLRFEYNGLTNIKASIKHLNIDWNKLVPQGAQSIGKNLPYKIKDWYYDPYVLQDGNLKAVGKTLRVICMDAGDDAYAFLKNNNENWSSIMSGSDKFSIAGWRYFDIKVNNDLQNIIKAYWQDGKKGGLLIGGNNYTIYGIYLYGDKQDDSSNTLAWKEDDTDLIDTYKNAIDGSAGWKEAKIPGSFFEYKSETGNQVQGSEVTSTTKLANTKNNIIRLVFEGKAPEGAQVSAKDTENNCEAAYIRQRQDDLSYVNFANCAGRDHYDFELSDAITIFKDYNIVKEGAEGVKTGMLSKLLLNGMNVGAKGAKIKKVQIRKSLISKYVKGYAELTGHALSASKWCSITFPYNLTHDQLKKAFGKDVRICELGSSKVMKELIRTGVNAGSYHYSILFNFEKIGDNEGVNANYPYLIKLGSEEHEKADNVYPIEGVVADVRDFQAYEFRSGKFNLKARDEASKKNPVQTVLDKEKEIIAALSKDNVCMKFKSTAPVFNISNTSDKSETKVEIINGVANDGFTLLTHPTTKDDDTYYYMRNGALWPVLTQKRRLASGRAYVILPKETKVLFDANKQSGTPNQSKSIIAYSIDDEGGNTTGIDEMEFSAPVVRQAQQNVYSLNGQMIRKGVSTVGLPKGIYIVGGKKLIVK